MSQPVLFSAAVDDMLQLVEESTRATPGGVVRFVEPAQGTLRRATSKRHHIVFGRRGSGKTSLLRKAAAELTLGRTPIAFVDLEPFKGHEYPDVLLSVLIASFREFKEWLESAAIAPKNKITFWRRLFGKTPSRKPLDKKRCASLCARLAAETKHLESELHRQDRSEVSRKSQAEGSESSSAEIGLGGDAPGFSAGAARERTRKSAEEVTESFRRDKTQFLLRNIMKYQSLMKDIAETADGDAFLFLDDLYHIPRKAQPDLLDYFHRIAKGNRLWLKVGTIRHRTDWYRHSNPPIGLKLGDEADDIDLDLTLEKYTITKDFLHRILSEFAKESKVELTELLSDGAETRLVLASGGVARDFLTILRRSVDAARERGAEHSRGPRVGAEDVNRASGDHDQTKRDELRRDVPEERVRIEEALSKIVEFCSEKTLCNCFLVENVATDDQVIHFHRNHRGPEDHPVMSRRFFARADCA
jgi:hypothetical protein